MNPYLNQLRKTRRAYERASRTIDRMRAELRTALDRNAESLAPVAEARDEYDDLFAPQIPLEHLEAVFCDPFAGDPDYQPWDDASIEADAAHVAELVECGDLCGLTIYGIPYRRNDDE